MAYQPNKQDKILVDLSSSLTLTSPQRQQYGWIRGLLGAEEQGEANKN